MPDVKRITIVFHDAKCVGLGGLPPELGSNPPMTIQGMENIFRLLPALDANGPYTKLAPLYCSRLARALDAASILCQYYKVDVQSMEELGQNANLDNGNVIKYPGCEAEDYVYWQDIGLKALKKIASGPGMNTLAVSHRPVIGGIVAFTKGITDSDGIAAIVGDKTLSAKGFLVFNVNEKSGEVTLAN